MSNKTADEMFEELGYKKFDNKYEAFKNNLLQRPITFLTEENLDKLETHCRRAIRYERGVEHQVVLELLERHKEHLAERVQDKKRIKELEEHLKKYYDGELYTAKQLKQIEENQKKYFINKQKVKDKIEEVHNMKFEDERLNSATIDFAVHKFEELLEGK